MGYLIPDEYRPGLSAVKQTQHFALFASIAFNNFAHLLNGRSQVALAEESRAANKSISANSGAFTCGLEVDSAINTDVVVQVPGSPPGLGLLNFREHFIDE